MDTKVITKRNFMLYSKRLKIVVYAYGLKYNLFVYRKVYLKHADSFLSQYNTNHILNYYISYDFVVCRVHQFNLNCFFFEYFILI